jgi:hypothetical protein
MSLGFRGALNNSSIASFISANRGRQFRDILLTRLSSPFAGATLAHWRTVPHCVRRRPATLRVADWRTGTNFRLERVAVNSLGRVQF